MKTGMAAIRANAIHRAVETEKERIITLFASNPSGRYRAVTKVARTILLNGPYLLNGRRWEVKANSLGVGVYELYVELQK